MSRFVLEVLTGPLKGDLFPIKGNLLIGRNKGDIRLKDPAVSSLHAEILWDSRGRVKVVDRDSKNKILFKGKKREELRLREGMKFQIGGTELCLKSTPSTGALLSQIIEGEAKRTELKDRHQPLKPFARATELLWISGSQKGEKYSLFYGPRVFGSSSVDLPIFEREAPGKAFALVPGEKEVFFVTDFPDQVRLNGKETAKSALKDGDRVSVGKAVLEIRFKED